MQATWNFGVLVMYHKKTKELASPGRRSLEGNGIIRL